MRKLNFSGAAVSLSVLTTVMGQCILSGEAVSARTLLLQGLPMALALAVISRLLALAEVEQGTFSGNTFCSKLFCLLATLWFGAELVETLGQIQTLCWEQFSSMALVGILPLLLWAGWTLEPGVFSRSAGILWWAVVLAAAICFFSLSGQLHWENLFPEPEMTGPMQLPIYAEFFVLPLFFEADGQKPQRYWVLPFAALLVQALFAFGREAVFGPAHGLQGLELLRAGSIGCIARFDAAFLLVWLAAAFFRCGMLVCTLRVLLCRAFGCGEQEVPE